MSVEEEPAWLQEDPSQPKMFALSGFVPSPPRYPAPAMVADRKGVLARIRELGGGFLDTDQWEPSITHVVIFLSHGKDCNGEKVMAAIAAGRWVVTKRYVEKSHKAGRWLNPGPYSHNRDQVLRLRKAMSKEGPKGGLFWRMKAVFVMRDERKNGVYSRIVRAGGGTVVSRWRSLEELSEQPPALREVTHVFLDPWPEDSSPLAFMSLARSSQSQGLELLMMDYKYLFHTVRGTPYTTVQDWEVTSPIVRWEARERARSGGQEGVEARRVVETISLESDEEEVDTVVQSHGGEDDTVEVNHPAPAPVPTCICICPAPAPADSTWIGAR